MQNCFMEFPDQAATAQVSICRVRDSFARLDASFYCGTGADTRQLLTQDHLKVTPLSDLAKVEQPTVFGKRMMQGAERNGIPLYATSELLNHVPTTDSYLSRQFVNQFDCLMAQPGTLLLSRSGSVGRPVLVPPWLSKIAIQDDVLKITASDPRVTCYLYAYFMSPIGQPILSDAAFGSVIQHIKVDHIRQVPVIVPDESTLSRIADLIARAERSRGAGRQALEEASQGVHTANRLPPLREDDTAWLDPEHSVESFYIQATAVSHCEVGHTECRLEAHFYNPTAQLAVANIKQRCTKVKMVGDVAERVLMGPRFKRNYVEAAHGIPFLSGKNIGQIRPTGLNYLSNIQMADMQELLVKGGWTLITCSGTIGRTCFVWKNYEDYAASQHILRVIPNESEIDPAYLYAFLSSRYGYEQILRYRHGSVIDEVTDKQVAQVLIPCPPRKEQTAIGNKVREAYKKRAEAIHLEDEAQAILMKELTKAPGTKGV